ncbi:hypothetical protein C8Q70DRAFT_586204 [Cubamyces menziesii]|nr:hypothetical protein C8Q70DRAFT_586204 [Cubamyces menziesii]
MTASHRNTQCRPQGALLPLQASRLTLVGVMNARLRRPILNSTTAPWRDWRRRPLLAIPVRSVNRQVTLARNALSIAPSCFSTANRNMVYSPPGRYHVTLLKKGNHATQMSLRNLFARSRLPLPYAPAAQGMHDCEQGSPRPPALNYHHRVDTARHTPRAPCTGFASSTATSRRSEHSGNTTRVSIAAGMSLSSTASSRNAQHRRARSPVVSKATPTPFVGSSVGSQCVCELTPKIPVATAEEAKRRGATVHPSAVDSPVPILAAATTQHARRTPRRTRSARHGYVAPKDGTGCTRSGVDILPDLVAATSSTSIDVPSVSSAAQDTARHEAWTVNARPCLARQRPTPQEREVSLRLCSGQRRVRWVCG